MNYKKNQFKPKFSGLGVNLGADDWIKEKEKIEQKLKQRH